MKVLVWQWGRFGVAPYLAVLLTEALRSLPGVSVVLSLSRRADILRSATPPHSDMPVETYRGPFTFILRALTAPFAIWNLVRRVRAHGPDLAVCVMPGPLDLTMAAALRWLGVKFVVIVHDADVHPGDGYPFLMWLQRRLCRSADAVAVLTEHVGARVCEQGLAGPGGRKLIRLSHPPLNFGVPPLQPHGGPLRLLFFGRLLPYKGFDLLAEALAMLGPRNDLTVRVVGSGPDSPALQALSRQCGVTVENRWVADDEIGGLLGWADAVVLPYREASQSGVAAAALAAGRSVVATRVGGLVEQLAAAPRAILCEPSAAGVAAALLQLLAAPRDAGAATDDPAAAWRTMAVSLLQQTSALVQHPGSDTRPGKNSRLGARRWPDFSGSPPS